MRFLFINRFFRSAHLAGMLALLSAPALSTPSAALPFSQKPEEIALNLEKKLRSIQTVQADFEQLHFSMSVSEPLQEKGKFFFRKPDWMRWEYKDPEEKVFLFRDGVYQFYIPEDNQLIRGASSRERLESEVLSIFSGKQSFSGRYIIEESPFPTENKASFQIKLTPKEEGEYSHILIEVNPKTWLFDRALFFEWAGNKLEFRFSRVKTGGRLSPEVFELKVPPDCEIIEEADAVKK
jgi:outer membrane lipoprotein carrier protein